MARKYNKAPKQVQIPKEFRYLRGIAFAIIAILTLVMNKTLAVRLVSILFIAVGHDDQIVALLVGCHPKTVKNLRAKMDDTTVAELMVIKPGSGRKPKASKDIVTDIVSTVTAKIFYNLPFQLGHKNYNFCKIPSLINQ